MRSPGLVPAALAAAAGIAIYAAQPPLSWWPLVLLAPAFLLEAVRRRDGSVWWLGLVAGLTAYLPMLAWLIEPAGFVAWVLLAGIQALFLLATVVLVRPVVDRGWIVLLAPVVWTGADVWRNLVPLGGFGWGSLAYAHAEGSWMLPVARVLGQHGLTFLTVLIAALVYDVARRLQRGRAVADRARAGFPGLQPAFAGLLAALLASVAITVEPPPTDGTLDVLIAQGNDNESWTAAGHEEDRRIANNLLELTHAATVTDGIPDLTVWPESSVDRDPFGEAGTDLEPIVVEAAAAVEGNLLAGMRLDGPRPRTFYNAAVLLGADATVEGRYVKRHLVPFGEYVPLRSVLGGFGPLRQVPSDGIPGDSPQTLEVDGGTLATLICFETLFPHLVLESVRDGHADIIVATTNDASFGRSAEPAQHLAQSQLRAVETGRWIVHAALSGASAFVDPTGAIHDRTELFELTTIRREVPLANGSTPFLTLGDVIGLGSRVAVVLIALALLAARVRRGRSTSESR